MLVMDGRLLMLEKTRRGLFLLVLATLAIGWGPAAALEIELKDVASDRMERQRSQIQGQLPLPGTPDVAKLTERLHAKGLAMGAPLMIRIFKASSELELWVRKDDTFTLFDTYPICHWSGTLGPKVFEGDRQAPEGFYTVGRGGLTRVGRWPRSFNLGFPNAFDRSLKRSGSFILIHGGCSSVGCYAMTNPVIEELFLLSEAALKSGQDRMQVHVFPFRMTIAALEARKKSEWSSTISRAATGATVSRIRSSGHRAAC